MATRLHWRRRLLMAALLPVLIGGCRAVRDSLRSGTAYERYADALRAADLESTALGGAWLAAGDNAIRRSPLVGLPFREIAYLPPDEPRALAYRTMLRRGERFVALVDGELTDPGQLFMDLLAPASDTTLPWRSIASALAGERTITFEAENDGVYTLRIQPELLRGGRLVVALRSEPTLAFPVAGRDSRAAHSLYGAPRDGGRRTHHGVDIFAPRGTAVIAAVDGWVTRVGSNERGGLVVWQRDDVRGHAIYYAHLDRHAIGAGKWAAAGDTIGFVGTSGNARGTPPHLHFGIYARGEGALDPFPFIDTRRSDPVPLRGDSALLASWARAATQTAVVSAPSARAESLAVLARGAAARVTGLSGAFYRVRLPDDREGYVPSRALEPAGRTSVTLAGSGVLIRARPAPDAPPIDSLTAPARLPVIGRSGDFLLVRLAGREGWLLDSARSTR